MGGSEWYIEASCQPSPWAAQGAYVPTTGDMSALGTALDRDLLNAQPPKVVLAVVLDTAHPGPGQHSDHALCQGDAAGDTKFRGDISVY